MSESNNVNPIAAVSSSSNGAKQSINNVGVVKETSVAAFDSMMASNTSVQKVPQQTTLTSVANHQSDEQIVTNKPKYESMASKLQNLAPEEITMDMVTQLMNESIIRTGIRRSQYIRDMNQAKPKIDTK